MMAASLSGLRRTPRATNVLLIVIGIMLTLLSIWGPSLHQRLGSIALTVICLVWALATLVALILVTRANDRASIWIIMIAAAAMRIAMIPMQPTLSTDLWRYIWDGRVQGAGINPYRYVPAAPELEKFRDKAVYPGINRVDYAPTIYPPAAQMLFWLITRFGETSSIMKAGLVLCEVLTIASVVGILALLGRPAAGVVAYAWHPLPVWEIAGNGHVDSAMTAMLMVGVFLFLKGRITLAGALVTIGALIKPPALLALPAFWSPWNWRLPLVFVATICLLYFPYISVGSAVLGFLPGYAQEEGIASGTGLWLLRVIELVTGKVPGFERFFLVIAGLVLALMALRAGFRSDRSAIGTATAISSMMVTFLLILSPNYPWYFVCVVPFLVLTNRLAPWILTGGGVLLYDVIPGDPSHIDGFVRQSLLYGGVLFALGFDFWSQPTGFRMRSQGVART